MMTGGVSQGLVVLSWTHGHMRAAGCHADGPRIADAEYVVLMPDLFHRVGEYSPLDGHSFEDDAQRHDPGDDEMKARDTIASIESGLGVSAAVGTFGYWMGGARDIAAAAFQIVSWPRPAYMGEPC
ncbi:hypothetical protein ACC702_03715 [Rhizobium ruizarguesonis]